MAQLDGRLEEARDAVVTCIGPWKATGDPVIEAYADFLIGWTDLYQVMMNPIARLSGSKAGSS